MRFVLVASILIACGAFARAADVELVRVWPAWRDAESFERIKEYFGAAETHAGQTVVRTQPGAREGYYFLVRVKNAAAPAPARFELNVIRPDAPDPKTFSFPVTLPAKGRVFQLGLTGTDWPGGEEANPVAWRLALVADDGRVLAEEKSFLWEKPVN